MRARLATLRKPSTRPGRSRPASCGSGETKVLLSGGLPRETGRAERLGAAETMTGAGAAGDGATVHVRSYAPHAETHAHDFHQMVLPVAGCLDLEVGDRGGRVMGAIGALVPSGERH